MFGNGRVGISTQGLKWLAKCGVAGVTHRDRNVAEEAGVAGAVDRGVAEELLELGFGKTRHCFKRRGKVGGGEGGLRSVWSLTVPGADVLTNVTAEDVGAHAAAMLFGDWPAEFDGQVGDAAAGIDGPSPVEGDDCLGGARFDTAVTGAAAVRGRAIGGEIERREDLAQEKPGALAFMNQTGIAANPAQAGFAGVGAFEQRGGVAADLVVERLDT